MIFFWLYQTACMILLSDQGFNLRHDSESAKSRPLDHPGIPDPWF